MNEFANSVEKHHQIIILSLASVIIFFAVACVFDNVLPICHYIFGCDHAFHASL